MAGSVRTRIFEAQPGESLRFERAELHGVYDALGSGNAPSHLSLDLEENSIGSAGAGKIADVLGSGNAPSHLLLSLGRNGIGPAGAEKISAALASGNAPPHLKLDLWGNDIRAAGAEKIANALRSGRAPPHLTLDLWENDIGAAGAVKIADALRSGNAPSHLKLDLWENSIGAAGAETIANSLCSGSAPPHLKFDLWGNDIGAAGAEKIANALSSGNAPPHLTLQLGSNNIGAGGAEKIANALSSGNAPPHLTLDLEESDVGAALMEYIANALISGSAPPHLTLQLARNNIGAAGAERIARVLSSGNAPSDVTLHIERNDIGTAGAEVIGSALNSQAPSEVTIRVSSEGSKKIIQRCCSGNARVSVSRVTIDREEYFEVHRKGKQEDPQLLAQLRQQLQQRTQQLAQLQQELSRSQELSWQREQRILLLQQQLAERHQQEAPPPPSLPSLPEVGWDDLKWKGRLAECKLGSGASGTVYKAEWGGEAVAVKLFNHPEGRSVMEREVRLLKRLVHPRVVQTLCVVRKAATGAEEERLGVVMELLPCNLPQHLRSKRKGASQAEQLQLAQDCAVGLSFLHNTGVVHGDVKGSNILVSGSGRAKVCDFGLSRPVEGYKGSYVSSLPAAGQGSVPWLPPEAFGDAPSAPLKEWDVYAFGVLLWEIVTGGKEPWGGVSIFQIAKRVGQDGERLAPPEGAHECLAQLAHKCCRRLPHDRPTLEKVRRALSRALKSAPDHKQRPPPPEELLCPISCEVMDDPVTCREGHSFDRMYILQALNGGMGGGRQVCPLDNVNPLKPADLRPNLTLRSMVERWKQM